MIDLGRILNDPTFNSTHRPKAIEMLEGLYGPKKYPWQSWFTDSRTEAVALLLYTGAIGGGAAPDARVAELEAKLKQIAEIAG